MRSCYGNNRLTSYDIYIYAVFFDGTNKIPFNKNSGHVKLTDGRTASVGSDNYLRIIYRFLNVESFINMI